MDDHRRAPLALVRLIGWVVSILTIIFIVRVLMRANLHWRDLTDVRWGMVLLAIGLFQVWYLVRGWIWLRLLPPTSEIIQVGNVGKVGLDVPVTTRLRQWVASELLRYIPGNIWSFVGRYRGAQQAGSERGRALSTIVIEAWILIIGAAIISAITLRSQSYGMWLVGGTIVFFGLPFFLRRFFSGKKTDLSWLAGLSTVNWLIYGVAFAVLFRALPAAPEVSWPMLIGTNVAAWLLGYLSLITPMGLGVREAVFIQLLGQFGVSNGFAAFAASIGRVLLILGEGIFFGLVLLAEIYSRRRARQRSQRQR